MLLGVDSFSILFNHPYFQQPDPFSLGFRRFSKKDPWKEWKWKVPLECCPKNRGFALGLLGVSTFEEQKAGREKYLEPAKGRPFSKRAKGLPNRENLRQNQAMPKNG